MEIKYLTPMVVSGPDANFVVHTIARKEQTWTQDPIVAEVITDTYRAVVTLRPHPVTGALGVTELRDVWPPAPWNIVRALGMGGVLPEIVRGRQIKYRWDDEVQDFVHDVDDPEGEPTPTPVDARRALRRGKKPISEDEIRRAAKLYREALEDGTTARRATATVAQQMGISVAAAGVRIRRAREELGILGPAVGTKAGEGER